MFFQDADENTDMGGDGMNHDDANMGGGMSDDNMSGDTTEENKDEAQM